MGGERKDRGGCAFSQWERGSGRLGELVGVSSIPVYPTEPWARRSHGNVGAGVPRDALGLGVWIPSPAPGGWNDSASHEHSMEEGKQSWRIPRRWVGSEGEVGSWGGLSWASQIQHCPSAGLQGGGNRTRREIAPAWNKPMENLLPWLAWMLSGCRGTSGTWPAAPSQPG